MIRLNLIGEMNGKINLWDLELGVGVGVGGYQGHGL